jgi:predicted DCC family thiol-disulfide oxidoreductase YuxK
MRVANPPAKPLLVFDGDCGFCRRWVERWRARTADRIDYLPFQELGDFPEIPHERLAQAVHLIETDGAVYSGAEAVFRLLGRPWLYRLPGMPMTSECAYRLVARHRQFFSKLTPKRQSYVLTRSVFIRFLGVIYLCAFVSLWTQITGLIGRRGIFPITYTMGEYARGNFDHNGFGAFELMPTVFWFGHSDAALHAVCGLGTALAVLVIAGVATMPALAVLWVLYLSVAVVGSVFFSFQWDMLLLETGFLAIWFAPVGSLRKSEPPRLVLWMLWWLLFRLMFMSGAVKLSSGDPTWHNLTALTFHYETQPLPTWLGWYAYQLPAWLQKASCVAVFMIELGLPFLIFLGRRARQAACAGFILLMTMIALTGNYCFFNLLAIALSLLLLDDQALTRLLRIKQPAGNVRLTRWRNWFFAPFAVAILIATVPLVFRASRIRVHWPRPLLYSYYSLHQDFDILRTANSYGLFAVMTTSRPEIIIEGSDDGQTWRPYEFKYKPGNLAHRPQFCWPHQPRLDWQMWFAALSDYQRNPWFIDFCARLLENDRTVTRLLAHNPFPEQAPVYIRALVYDYRFTTFAERRATGHWWKRELLGWYCPVLSLREN